MADDLSHELAQDLLGARALYALDEEERQQVDGHLAGCSECSQLLGRLQRAAVAVLDDEDAPPPGVWERIRERLGDRAPDGC